MVGQPCVRIPCIHCTEPVIEAVSCGEFQSCRGRRRSCQSDQCRTIQSGKIKIPPKFKFGDILLTNLGITNASHRLTVTSRSRPCAFSILYSSCCRGVNLVCTLLCRLLSLLLTGSAYSNLSQWPQKSYFASDLPCPLFC